MAEKLDVLHIEPLRYNAETRAALLPYCAVDYLDVNTQGELLLAIRKKPYEALFVKLGVSIDRSVFEAAPELQFIVTPTTGLDHIDLEEAEKRGIQVISLKGEVDFLRDIKSTAEHTWAILLALLRKIPAACSDVCEGHWRREPFLGTELNGKTLGIIGYGRLGTIVAGYGQAFHMRVIVNDTDEDKLAHLAPGLEPSNLDYLLRESDIISLHIPSDSRNYHFLNQDKADRMKKGVVLINTARGEVVDGQVLLQALEKGQIAAAAIDVIEGDSSWDQGIPEEQALVEYARRRDNLLITPHIGGYALESIEGTRAFVVDKFLNAINGI